ncbi:NADH-quinone oxidoreductase subunit G (plasmid) [Komagataeibacter saccharivorans]|uniref:NADH-quinone oxidoreductase subunit G n=1 Tax=Komagataeibacter saccharivorans TaxID=265959 RepID=A0A347WG52_9PROT|nr:NADH-quinone oxidoreductase subunit G [Komagataeibacter saccharivorans]
MTTIRIDGREWPTRPGINLLQACLEAGANLPYFCWHPELGSVGACRQCAVRQFSGPDDRTGRLVMACMTPVSDGAIIAIEDAQARAFREGVIEWMMVNHPHDCPVCEEGGECHLQDMTVMTGHNQRRYRFTKRTHRNQDLGPFVKHEMNRCIACYRCVRFYRDYAGGDDLAAFASHDSVYFGRAEDGALQNAFSGNLVEICPTGVFTDKPFSAVYTRKWDLRGAPSVCVHCAVGCNIIVNAREESVRRVVNRYNAAVNRYMLCDRGRFGHGFVNADSRIRMPLRSIDGHPAPVPTRDAVMQFARMAADGPVVGIASPAHPWKPVSACAPLSGRHGFQPGRRRLNRHAGNWPARCCGSIRVSFPACMKWKARMACWFWGKMSALLPPGWACRCASPSASQPSLWPMRRKCRAGWMPPYAPSAVMRHPACSSLPLPQRIWTPWPRSAFARCLTISRASVSP